MTICLASKAQNSVIVDVAAENLQNQSAKLDPTKPFKISLINAGTEKNVRLSFDFNNVYNQPQKTFTVIDGITLTPGSGFVLVAANTGFTMSFTLLRTGKHFKVIIGTDGGMTYQNDTPIVSANAIDNNALFSNTPHDQTDIINKKYKNLVIFDPCNKTYTIYRNGIKKNTLWFHGAPYAGLQGVVFLIDNFNTVKYDVTVTSSFIDNTYAIPDVFSSVGTLMTVGAPASTLGGFKMAELAKLNASLKTLLNHDCGNFYDAKNKVNTYLTANFGGDLQQSYNTAMTTFLTTINPATTKPYTNKEANTVLKEDYRLTVTPDSLVKETLKLISALQLSPFSYEYDVPQLQNADQLQFNLTVAPTANAFSGVKTGGLNINGPITLPILGGWKFDFSAGFFYTSKKNQTYTLRKNQAGSGDTTKSSIIMEDNYNGGTIGVNGLMHAYYRFADGFTPALSFGVGKSLDLNYTVLGGISALFNVSGQNKIGLTYGVNYTSIKAPSMAFRNNDGTFVQQPASVTAVTYANKFVWGKFFSLTYTFGLTKATQPASTAAAASASTSAATSTTGAATSAAGGKKSKS
ncbi:hypothetical protein HYN43_002535 [Mucilaginibacter celer]|uniref:Uncharacterized protein n=2 Tax=Mucilaginibacter celer TaxID=2305508 RepID=A0A494VHL9_9SPHI|nr:hypothetical protein HYN43_002535 [Mucilaginibacter celer]